MMRAGRPRLKDAPILRRARFRSFRRSAYSAPSPNATAGNAAWHPKQSISTET